MGVTRARILSEAQAQPEAEIALVRTRAGHRHEVAQVANCAVIIQPHIGYVRRRIVEVRRIGEVERLRTELQIELLGDRERAKYRDIGVHHTRTIKDVATARPIADLGDGAEGQRIEKWHVDPDPAEFFHYRLHLVSGALRRSRSVKAAEILVRLGAPPLLDILTAEGGIGTCPACS